MRASPPVAWPGVVKHDAESQCVGRAETACPAPALKWLGRVEYEPTWRAMQSRTDAAARDTPDEIWFLEHPPVFTQGMNGRSEHVLAPGDIPVIEIDRGGQVTYHGPGQLVVYPLLDLSRLGLGVRPLVTGIEGAVIAALSRGASRLTASAMRPACMSTTARSRAWGCASGAGVHITALRSTSRWNWNRSRGSIPAATRASR